MGFKPFLSPDWLPALYVLQALSCWAMRSSKSWRDREQELLALEVAGARIHSSMERNLEGEDPGGQELAFSCAWTLQPGWPWQKTFA